MREVARSRNLLSGFVTTLKRLFESVVGTLFCLLLYVLLELSARLIMVTYVHTVGDKIKFPLCTDLPPTCEWSCQQKSPKSRPKVARDLRRILNVFKKVADLFLSGQKIVCTRIQFRPKSRACTNGTRKS